MVNKILPVFSIIIDFLDPSFLVTLALINIETRDYINYYTHNIGYQKFIIHKIKKINNKVYVGNKLVYLKDVKLVFNKNLPIFILKNINFPIQISEYVKWKIINKYYSFHGKIFINPHLNLNHEGFQYFQQQENSLKYQQKITIKYNTTEQKYYLSDFQIKFNKIQYLFYEPFSLTENILNLLESDNFCIQYISFIIIYFLALLLFLTGNFISVKILEIIFN
jgi:hypothetical protein